jgi:hypothetical protein
LTGEKRAAAYQLRIQEEGFLLKGFRRVPVANPF